VRGSIADPFFRLVGLPTAEELRQAGLDPAAYVANERDWYDGSVFAMDAEIGRLMERLRAPDLAGRVLVVLVSDHGEEFLEHGRMFHGQSVFGELTNVPLLFWRPGALPAGARVRATVETLDVMPTLLELSGIESPAGLQGRSLAPLLRAAGRPSFSAGAARPAFSEKRALDDILGPPPRDTESYAVVWDGWKLVHHVRRGAAVPEHQLFDHARDPLDRLDVADRHPEVVARWSDLLRRWRERVEAARLPGDGDLAPRLSAAELERLRSLGYL
jgi:arylsulfatase A-like enzyme